MPIRLEKSIEQKVVLWATAQGIAHLKLNLMGNTGWPDQLFRLKGRLVFIEFKRPGEDLKRNQPERIEELVADGFTVGVFDEFETATRFLTETLLSPTWKQEGKCTMKLNARTGVFYGGERIRRTA